MIAPSINSTRPTSRNNRFHSESKEESSKNNALEGPWRNVSQSLSAAIGSLCPAVATMSATLRSAASASGIGAGAGFLLSISTELLVELWPQLIQIISGFPEFALRAARNRGQRTINQALSLLASGIRPEGQTDCGNRNHLPPGPRHKTFSDNRPYGLRIGWVEGSNRRGNVSGRNYPGIS